MTGPRMSPEQGRRIVELVGACEIHRRGWNLPQLDRHDASDLIISLVDELRELELGERPRRSAIGTGRPAIDKTKARRARRRRLARELETDPADPRHGTLNGYVNGGCRCEQTVDGTPGCGPVARAYFRDYDHRRRNRPT